MSEKKKKILISWIGGNDVKNVNSTELGPILATLISNEFDIVSARRLDGTFQWP